VSLYHIPPADGTGNPAVTIGWDPRQHTFFFNAEPSPDNADWVRIADEPDIDVIISFAEQFTYVPLHVIAQLNADQAHGCAQPDHDHADHIHDQATPALAIEETIADVVSAAAGLSAYAAAHRKGNAAQAAFALRELNHAGHTNLVATLLKNLITTSLNNLSHATLNTLTGRDACAVVVTGDNVVHIGVDHPDDLNHAELDNYDPARGIDTALSMIGYPPEQYTIHTLADYGTHQVIYLRPIR